MTLPTSPSLLALLFLASASAHAAEEVDNGTDPTKLTTSLVVSYQHTDLRSGKSTGLYQLEGTMPLGSGYCCHR